MDPIVVAQGLTKRYGELTAVDGIDLSINRGEVFGILGPNGAGKTTTVKMLCTLLRPTAGQASVCGFDVVAEPFQVRDRLGYVSQEQMSDVFLTGQENLQMLGNLYHLKKAMIAPRVDELLKLVGLEEARHRIVKNYSGGMKKKLDIAGGLIHSPEVLFLDEPSLGLDVPARRLVWEHLRGLRSQGITIFLCTNYMDEAEQLCDRVAIIDGGRLRACGPVDRLKQEVGGEVVRLFLENEADGLQDAFAALPFVSRVIPGAESWNVFVRYDDTVIPALLRAASERRVTVRSFQFSRPTLDDVFLKNTGHRMDDSSAVISPADQRRR